MKLQIHFALLQGLREIIVTTLHHLAGQRPQPHRWLGPLQFLQLLQHLRNQKVQNYLIRRIKRSLSKLRKKCTHPKLQKKKTFQNLAKMAAV